MLKDKIFIVIGIIILLFSVPFFLIFFLLLAICISASYDPAVTSNITMDVVVSYFIFFSIFFFPGLCLYIKGRRLMKTEKETKMNVPEIVNIYRRISISTLCMKINKSEAETIRLVNKYIKKGLIKGKLDMVTGEIITEKALNDKKDISTRCPNCGAFVNKTILTGENLICEYCGTNLSMNIGRK